MKNFPKISLTLFAIIALFADCQRNDQFEDTPHLEWRDYEIVTTEGNRRNIILTTYFTDGDGDIGRQDTTSIECPPLEIYDLYISYFEKVEDSYVEVVPPDSCQRNHIFLPDITREGQNKTLEGEISTEFSYSAYPENPGVDSVKFELQLKDRAGNKSEIVTSGPIFIPPQ